MTGIRRAVTSAGRVSRLPGRRVTPNAVSRRPAMSMLTPYAPPWVVDKNEFRAHDAKSCTKPCRASDKGNTRMLAGRRLRTEQRPSSVTTVAEEGLAIQVQRRAGGRCLATVSCVNYI